MVQPDVFEVMRRFPEIFITDPLNGDVWVHPRLATYEERSEGVNSVLRQWREESLFLTLKGWRDEVSSRIHHFRILT